MSRHLLQQGHRRMRLLLGPRTKPIHQHYFEGDRAACLDAGLSEREIEASVEEVAVPDPVEAVQRLLSDIASMNTLCKPRLVSGDRERSFSYSAFASRSGASPH